LGPKERYTIVSLDVVSLFSNIPLQLVLEDISSNWNTIKTHCKIPLNYFMDIINFIFENNYFSFNKQFYTQIFGTPMGSNLSPTLAKRIMDNLLNDCISKLTFNLPFIKKYVDDIICAVPSDKTEELLQVFNNYNKDIQFTIELENDFSVPFLDTKLIRTPQNTIILDWYQKPTNSGRYINYLSHHTAKIKINFILGLKTRIKKISHPSFVQKNLLKLEKILINNSYPPFLLKKLLFNCVPNTNMNIADNPTEPTKPIYVKLPHIDNLTPKLKNVFKNSNFLFALYNLKTINHVFSKLKDPIPIPLSSNVIYKIPCLNCPSCYIGQTKQLLKNRISQHKSDSKLPNKTCALAHHVRDNKHIMDFNNTTILDREDILQKRLFLEMVHINKNENSMNFRSDINNLSIIYTFLLQR
jgi:hypothetical protein